MTESESLKEDDTSLTWQMVEENDKPISRLQRKMMLIDNGVDKKMLLIRELNRFVAAGNI